MTTLVIQTLYTGATLSQSFTLGLNTRTHIESIAPYIYMHNAPSGAFTISVHDANDVSLFSGSFTSAQIKTALNTASNYAHAFYPILTDGALKLEAGEYKIVMSSYGYTQNSDSFIAWVQQHEDLNNELDYVPLDDSENPLSLRIKILKRGIDG